MYIPKVVPYKECKAEQVPQYYSETELTPKKFTEKSCITGKKSVPHKKLLPECRNVTKQNCVTNWETDEYGKQVSDIVSMTYGQYTLTTWILPFHNYPRCGLVQMPVSQLPGRSVS